VKLAALHEFMVEHQVNIAAIMECNAAWSTIDPDIWPQQQTHYWWENVHWSLTHNTLTWQPDTNQGNWSPCCEPALVSHAMTR